MIEKLKANIVANLVGAVVFFLVIHFAFGTGNLTEDIIETVIFFILMNLVSAFIAKHSDKEKKN
ncbi:hypothetical protein G6R29_03350 [Fructobacillus sp. M2-14]|uniref:Uncharacterized protein n=1 Tax=Fructobacillus broussonetiae TaxID=2713173 RepID=A0ABS5R3D8_9LACO|nr:hypothetical protein [Fructobacillus broussonetiae]MBS9338667.1 hypothetical protein [Fructobacillus broussonetiae]